MIRKYAQLNKDGFMVPLSFGPKSVRNFAPEKSYKTAKSKQGLFWREISGTNFQLHALKIIHVENKTLTCVLSFKNNQQFVVFWTVL